MTGPCKWNTIIKACTKLAKHKIYGWYVQNLKTGTVANAVRYAPCQAIVPQITGGEKEVGELLELEVNAHVKTIIKEFGDSQKPEPSQLAHIRRESPFQIVLSQSPARWLILHHYKQKKEVICTKHYLGTFILHTHDFRIRKTLVYSFRA